MEYGGFISMNRNRETMVRMLSWQNMQTCCGTAGLLLPIQGRPYHEFGSYSGALTEALGVAAEVQEDCQWAWAL